MMSLSVCSGVVSTRMSSSGLPSITSRSASAPGATTPSSPSRHSSRAAVVVAERIRSAGGWTWDRMTNSCSC